MRGRRWAPSPTTRSRRSARSTWPPAASAATPATATWRAGPERAGRPRPRVCRRGRGPRRGPNAAHPVPGDRRLPVSGGDQANVGGSGAGIGRFDTRAELEARAASLDLGPDRTALLQGFVEAEGGAIVRVGVLDGRASAQSWPESPQVSRLTRYAGSS